MEEIFVAFWKKPVYDNINKENTHIVFLGDYLDAYESLENIIPEDAIANFEEIIDVTNSANNITLLLGNHDLHYFPQLLNCYGCRRYNQYKHDISNMFMSNINLFKLAYEININNKNYLFTHAGVLEDWFKLLIGENRVKTLLKDLLWVDVMKFPDNIKEKFTSLKFNADSLNTLLTFNEGINTLWMISRERGGRDRDGSCVWADIHEHFIAQQYNNTSTWYNDTYQIFAHTINYPSLNDYYIDDNIAMLDSSKAFILNNNGLNIID